MVISVETTNEAYKSLAKQALSGQSISGQQAAYVPTAKTKHRCQLSHKFKIKTKSGDDGTANNTSGEMVWKFAII